MISFNRFVVASATATLIIMTVGWASASPADPAFRKAQEDVRNAPSFCAVTYIQRDYTRGWVAVCELAVSP